MSKTYKIKTIIKDEITHDYHVSVEDNDRVEAITVDGKWMTKFGLFRTSSEGRLGYITVTEGEEPIFTIDPPPVVLPDVGKNKVKKPVVFKIKGIGVVVGDNRVIEISNPSVLAYGDATILVSDTWFYENKVDKSGFITLSESGAPTYHREHPDNKIDPPEDVSCETIEPEKTFERELTVLINKHSLENGSNTPDMILAKYLLNCLSVFNIATKERSTWYRGDEDRCDFKTTK